MRTGYIVIAEGGVDQVSMNPRIALKRCEELKAQGKHAFCFAADAIRTPWDDEKMVERGKEKEKSANEGKADGRLR
jgi:hypothetical protein